MISSSHAGIPSSGALMRSDGTGSLRCERRVSNALAAAIGIPDAILGEKAAAYVELRLGAALDLADLTAHLEASRVARELWPEALVVLDALPQSAGGKVAKGALRDDAATRFALDEATDLEARSRAGRRTDPV